MMDSLLLIHIIVGCVASGIVSCVAWGIAICKMSKILESVTQKLSLSKPMPSHRMTPDAEQLQDVRQSAPSPAPEPGISPDNVDVFSEIDQILAQYESDSMEINQSIDRIVRELDWFETFLREKHMNFLRCQNDSRMQELPSVNDDKKNELVIVPEVTTPLLKETPDPVTTDAVDEKPKPDFDTSKEETEDVSVPKSLAQLWTGALALQEAIDETTETGNDIQIGMISSETQPLTEENLSIVPDQRPYTAQTEDQPAIVHATELGTEKRPDSVEVKNEPRVGETIDDSTALETALPHAGGTEPETALLSAEGTEIETALPRTDEIEPAALAQSASNKSPESVYIQKFITFFDVLIKKSKKPNRKSRAKYEKRLEKLVEKEWRCSQKGKDWCKSPKEGRTIIKAIMTLERIYESDKNQMEQILQAQRTELDYQKYDVTSIANKDKRNEMQEMIRLKEIALNIVAREQESEMASKLDELVNAMDLFLEPADSE